MAAVITSSCAAFYYGLLSIYTHVCQCMQAGLKSFTWFEKLKPFSMTSSQVTKEKSSGYKEDDDDTTGEEHLKSQKMEECMKETIEDVLESIMNDM